MGNQPFKISDPVRDRLLTGSISFPGACNSSLVAVSRSEEVCEYLPIYTVVSGTNGVDVTNGTG